MPHKRKPSLKTMKRINKTSRIVKKQKKRIGNKKRTTERV